MTRLIQLTDTICIAVEKTLTLKLGELQVVPSNQHNLLIASRTMKTVYEKQLQRKKFLSLTEKITLY